MMRVARTLSDKSMSARTWAGLPQRMERKDHVDHLRRHVDRNRVHAENDKWPHRTLMAQPVHQPDEDGEDHKIQTRHEMENESVQSFLLMGIQ